MSGTSPGNPLTLRPGPVAGLAGPGCPPDWLHQGLCAAWGWDPARTHLRLLAVDRHASFVVLIDRHPTAMARLSEPPYMEDTAATESEVAWMSDLDAAGVVHVPPVISSVDGRDLALLADEDDRHWVCLLTRWAGRPDDGDAVPDRLRTLGTTAARMHEHALGYHRPRDFVRPTWDTADLVGPEARWGNWRTRDLDPAVLSLLGRAEQLALDVLHQASRAPDSWGLVHGDLRAQRLLIERGRVTVLDFEHCGFSWFMFDLAAAVVGGSDPGEPGRAEGRAPELAERAQAWVRGYQEVRPLTRGDAALASALVMLRGLQLLGRHGGGQSLAMLTAESFLRDPGWLLR